MQMQTVMKSSRTRWSRPNRRARRNGIVTVYVALGLIAFLGVAAISVDVSYLYNRKAKAQLAADATALAGAWKLASSDELDPARREADAKSMADTYVSQNGYRAGVVNGLTTTITYDYYARNGTAFKATIVRDEPTFFAGVLGRSRVPVGAAATAVYETFAPLDIYGGGVYGQPDGPTTLSLFGPDGFYNHGDDISTRFLPDGTANPKYDGKGFDFTITVPPTYTGTDIELYDPDGYNAGGVATAQAGVRVDELWTSSGRAGSNADATTTQYRIYWDNNTPDTITDDVLLPSGDKSYGNDSSTDMRWNTVFQFNRANYPTGNFRLNVTSTAGASENGFLIRAKPTGQAFASDNGTGVTAQKQLPMNFNGSGQSNIGLGTVPAEAANKTLSINMYDTDVGNNNTVVYTCDGLPGQSWSFALPGNGQHGTHNITLPSNYPGGYWKALYTAGRQDTSVWNMTYTGVGPGRPGRIKLVD